MRIHQSIFFVFPLFVTFFLSLNAFGETYHVKQDGTGDFTSIQACVNWITAGDTCIVHEGTYHERITFSSGQSGAPGQWTTIKAEPARSVTMQGFNTQNADYLHIEGFCITDAPSGWEGAGFWVASSHIKIINNYLYEIPYIGIVGTWSDPASEDVYVANNRIYFCHAGVVAQGNGWVVENNEVERLYHYGTYSCDYMRFFGENHVFRGNKLFGTFSSEIGSSHVDCFQTFDNNTDGAPISNVLIENNICLGFFHQGFMGEADFYNNTSNITIRNNIFAHGSSWGVCIDSNIKNVVVLNNIFADIGYHGCGFRNNATGRVLNNIFYNVGTSYWANGGAVLEEGDYNLIFNATAPPVSGPHDLIGLDPRFADFSNNDFTFHIESPAIDRGGEVDVFEDIEGNPRPMDGDCNGTACWDIGPYEFAGYLTADKSTLSEFSGGRIDFTLNGGYSNPHRTYLLLGTVSGTEPGYLLPGNLAVLPLNWDAFTDAIIMNIDAPSPFESFLGTLDAAGRGAAWIETPPLPPGLVGIKLHFAYCLNHPFDFVSNPFEIEIVP
ncbi:MAG: right-handed parallel beta-helix repeat-containing protein [Planctomycetes bacterium]|nr:right-handed parallel beta-helix repeat-containing protein [Planctomycetota bacterium]